MHEAGVLRFTTQALQLVTLRRDGSYLVTAFSKHLITHALLNNGLWSAKSPSPILTRLSLIQSIGHCQYSQPRSLLLSEERVQLIFVMIPSSECSRSARKLADLFASLPVSSQWGEVQQTAQKLANGLRVHSEEDEHTSLGRTLLPQTLTSLLKAAIEGSKTPDEDRSPAILELLRVGANLCMDHDENRGYLLEAGFPQTILPILDAYAENVDTIYPLQLLQLPKLHLEIVKTMVGALLNCSLDYEPVQLELISKEAPTTFIKIATVVYPPGSWTKLNSDDSLTWALRRTISDWSWRAISALKSTSQQQPVFGPESLPFLVAPLHVYIPPFGSLSASMESDAEARRLYITTDLEILDEAAELLESLSLDVEEVRVVLVQEVISKSAQTPQVYLTLLLNFVEHGTYPSYWSKEPNAVVTSWQKRLDLCKSVIVKTVVEAIAEEKNHDILWKHPEDDHSLLSRLIRWLRIYPSLSPSEARDDLVICSTISLANLVRNDAHSKTLVHPPINLGSDLLPFLRPEVDFKVKHGAIGLLKHLAQPPSNRSLLGEAGVVQALVTSGIFKTEHSLAEIVQLSAIGVVKNMCTNNVENSISFTLPVKEADSSDTGLGQVVHLVHRSDIVHVKSEGTRVLVNVIKSLCSATGDLQDSRRRTAIQSIITPRSTDALAALFARSKKYPVLINEATMALYLLAVQPNGAVLCLESFVKKTSQELMQVRSSGSATSGISSEDVPLSALEMTTTVLKNEDDKFPAEIRANICALLAELGKLDHGPSGEKVETLQTVTKEYLQSTAKSSNLALAAAARDTLESWK